MFGWGLSRGSDGKESACNAPDLDSIPGSGKSPEEGNGYPLQYSCLENLMDSGAWQATAMEEEIATHSSILAWEIPQTEETGGLQFMGSQRVGQG